MVRLLFLACIIPAFLVLMDGGCKQARAIAAWDKQDHLVKKEANARILDADASFRADQLNTLVREAEKLRTAEHWNPLQPDIYSDVILRLIIATHSAQRLLRIASHAKLQTAAKSAAVFIEQLKTWNKADEKYEKLLDALASLRDFPTHEAKRKLLSAIESYEKLSEIRELIIESGIKMDRNRNTDQFLFTSEVQLAEKICSDIIKDKSLVQSAVTELRAEHSRLSQVITAKPGKKILERLQRQELPDLMTAFNMIAPHYTEPPTIHYEDGRVISVAMHAFNTTLNELESQLNDKLREANENEPTLQEYNPQADEQKIGQHDDANLARDSEANLDVSEVSEKQQESDVNEERDFLLKKISALEAAIARLKMEREKAELGKIGNESPEQKQVPIRPTTANKRYLQRIAELEQTLGREFMLIEEGRRDIEEQDPLLRYVRESGAECSLKEKHAEDKAENSDGM